MAPYRNKTGELLSWIGLGITIAGGPERFDNLERDEVFALNKAVAKKAKKKLSRIQTVVDSFRHRNKNVDVQGQTVAKLGRIRIGAAEGLIERECSMTRQSNKRTLQEDCKQGQPEEE